MTDTKEQTMTGLKARKAFLLGVMSTQDVAGAMESQRELSQINAEIKRLNIAEAAELKRIADERRIAGTAENRARANLARYASPPHKGPHTVPIQKQPAGTMTIGEFLLHNAKKLLKTIDHVKAEQHLPHTVEFRKALIAFIEIQPKHIAANKAVYHDGEIPSEWAEAWKAGK